MFGAYILLFQSHTEFTHFLWKQQIQPGKTVLDATAGRGLDTLFLAKLLFPNSSSRLIALDIQKDAIEATQSRLKTEGLLDGNNIEIIQQSHSDLRLFLKPNEASLITYNLGYLPGGNKSITTLLDSTKSSLISAKECLEESGMISITFYPGHPAGFIEKDMLIPWIFEWDPKAWAISRHSFALRESSPSVVIAQRKCEQ